jgi:hypothetical protein
MRQQLIILILLVFFSCNKDLPNTNNIIGSWNWKTSYSSTGAQILSRDTTKVYSILFKPDNSFVNQTFCIVGGSTDGSYQLKNFNNNRFLILNVGNTSYDTLQLSIDGNKMTLNETYNGYSWYHYFNKKLIE